MWFKRLLKFLLLLLIGIILIIALFIGSVFIGVFGPLPDENELISITHEQASLVYSNNGKIIGKYFAENRTNIKWQDVPENLVNALIATEDKRFYQHQGIDSRSYLRVLFKSILMGDKSAGGGSTLTQQLVKNLYGRDDHSFLSMPISKTREAIIASRMEGVLTKEDILLLYLNSVPFGEEVFGIEAASKRYFDKSASELKIEESAVLVGLLKANTYYNPRLNPEHAITRRNTVIALMANEGYLSILEADSLKKLKLKLKYTNYQLESPAGYFVYQVKKRVLEILEKEINVKGKSYDLQKDGLRIHTTLDLELQHLANRAAQKQLAKMQPMLDKELIHRNTRKKWESAENQEGRKGDKWEEKQNREILTTSGMATANISKMDSLWHYHKMLNAAVLAANPQNGAVLAWTGGNNFRYLPYDLILAERQIASTIKPFIYASALEEGYETCDYFDNILREYYEYDGWKPENYDGSSSEKMKVAMWYALSHSLNLPTVDLYFKTGHDEVADVCRRFGIEAPFEVTPAIALGALDASLYELVQAYSAFATGGLLPEDLIMIEKITDSNGNILYKNDEVKQERVIVQQYAEQINTMLKLAVDDGTGTSLRSRYRLQAELAGKTGTAQDYRDAWFIAYTPELVLGTWVGARSPQMHFNSGLGSGSSLALPVAGEVLSAVENNPVMSRQYLQSFELLSKASDSLDCEPFREKGLSGILNRMTKKEKEVNETIEPKEIPPEDTTVKERSKVRKFFDNLFGKKKDKKKKRKKD